MKHTPKILCIVVGLMLLVVIPTGSLLAQEASRDPRIVGGQDVPDPNPYFWQVSIGRKGVDNIDDENLGHFCGGSVISETWILTAAHCVIGDTPEQNETADNIRVIYNNRVRTEATAEKEVNVKQIITHPDYNSTNFSNDVALLELETAIPANFIIPMMTTDQEEGLASPSTNAIVSGWGGLKGYEPDQQGPDGGQTFPDVLQYVEIPIVSNETCEGSESQICAGAAEGGRDSCQNDSGGPLVVSDGANGYIQVGIVSFGNGCAAANNYGYYARVSSYRSWINEQTGTSSTEDTFVYLPMMIKSPQSAQPTTEPETTPTVTPETTPTTEPEMTPTASPSEGITNLAVDINGEACVTEFDVDGTIWTITFDYASTVGIKQEVEAFEYNAQFAGGDEAGESSYHDEGFSNNSSDGGQTGSVVLPICAAPGTNTSATITAYAQDNNNERLESSIEVDLQ